MRCPECGRNNPDTLAVCPVCHALLPRPVGVGDSQRTRTSTYVPTRMIAQRAHQQVGAQPRPHSINSNRRQTSIAPYRPQPVPHVAGIDMTGTRQQGDVTGRVIAVDGPHQEQPNPDLCRILTRLLWLLLLVVSPIVFLRVVLDTLGGFSAIIALVGLFFLLRFFSPMNLFAMVNLFALFNPTRRREAEPQVPVRYFRIRGLDEETEYIVRMKGPYTYGNIMQDDLLSIWGRWRSGVLEATRAFNHRTQSWIDLQRSSSWVGLVMTLVIVALLVAYFYHPVDQIFMKLQELPTVGGPR